MNKTFEEAETLINAISSRNDIPDDVELVLIPPFPYLPMAVEMTANKPRLNTGAQNCYWKNEGAFTGEISPKMIKSIGSNYVLIGHSERRKYFNESNEQLSAKTSAALGNDLIPVFCCGENLEDRDKATHFNIVETQISEGLFHLEKDLFQKVILAYEPVWAIGTGVTAKPSQAQEMHAHIRKVISGKYGSEIAEELTILYGGSCKPGNANQLFSQPDVDGGLIGGASLKADDFIAIANAY